MADASTLPAVLRASAEHHGDRTAVRDGSVELGRLAAYVRDKRIPLEMCPWSNIQTGAAASIAEHPIGLLKKLRFRVTVNTDNRLMSQTSMTHEMTSLVEAFGYAPEHVRAPIALGAEQSRQDEARAHYAALAASGELPVPEKKR